MWFRTLRQRSQPRAGRVSRSLPSPRGKARVRGFRPRVETLEPRCVPAIVPGLPVNISQFPGNQNETAIAMDPTNPQHLFEVSNDEFLAAGSGGLLAAFSLDGGATWSREYLGTGTGTSTLPAACCDAQAVFDDFGNLFVSYLNASVNEAELLLSVDSGLNFRLLHSFAASDRPKLAVGAGSIWISYNDGTGISVSGAGVAGLGTVGAFSAPQQLSGSGGASFGEIAIGPSGQVMVIAPEPTTPSSLLGDEGPDVLVGWLNPIGLGGTFGSNRVITLTQVGQQFTNVAAQSNSMGIDSEPQLAWDRSSGQFNGRLYFVYTDAPSPQSVTTDLFERFSDDNGATWSGPIKINDNAVPDAVFLPSLAIDQSTGNLAIQFYDTRMDQGQGGPLDPSGSALDDAQLWASAGFVGGTVWNKNVQISAGTSFSSQSGKSIPAGLRPLGFGDYQESTAFFNGVWYPVWADNSNSTGDNPDGVLHQMDIYTAKVTISPMLQAFNPFSFASSPWGSWSPSAPWSKVVRGDFNGDGQTDIAGFIQQTGQWWVSLSTGSSFATSLWTTWAPNVTWVDLQVGDFNGDGKMDIAGRVLETGQWWVGESTGFSFVNSLWTTWYSGVTWVDVNVGDFTGDHKSDIIGRVLQSGQWWVGQSTGSSFANSLWATWSPAVTWVDVQVGDFNGDGRADITGRVLQSGQWWTGISTGAGFATSLWATWDPNVTWIDVQVGDFNGDGKADIVGRVLQSGQWWVGQSTGNSFNASLWATWNPNVTWGNVKVGDFNGDGMDDITAMAMGTGQWWTGLSTGSTFNTSLWATWNPSVTWIDVQAGHFGLGEGITAMAEESGQWWAGVRPHPLI